MKTIIIFFVSFILQHECLGQNEFTEVPKANTDGVFKKYIYSSPEQSFNQELILKKDSTFKYSFRAGLIKKEVKGTWQIFNSVLFLKRFDTSDNIIIKEFVSNRIPEDRLEFKISDFKGSSLNYGLSLMNENGSIKTYDTSSLVLNVPIVQVKYFLVSFVIKYDKYYPINKKSNYFEILINTDKVFVNPIWMIKGNKIFMLTTKNEMTDDYFMQE